MSTRRLIVISVLSVASSPLDAQEACRESKPTLGGARLEATVTRTATGFRYDYVAVNPSTSTGCVSGALLDVSTAVLGTVSIAGSLERWADTQGTVTPGQYEAPSAPYCSGGVGGVGRISWACHGEPVQGTDPVQFLPGRVARPGESLPMFSIESAHEPGPRDYRLFVRWDFVGVSPEPSGKTIGPTPAAELVVYDGGGQKPVDVNKFLTYTNPVEHRTRLPATGTRFPLSVRYGATVAAATFRAFLNGTDITSRFAPSPGGVDVVTLDLAPGSNTVTLSVDGTTGSGRTATDTDRLVLLVAE